MVNNQVSKLLVGVFTILVFGVFFAEAANITVSLAPVPATYTVGNTIFYELNVTNTDSQNISVIWVNATYNQSIISYDASYPALTSNNSGTVFWMNILSTNLTPGENTTVYFNMTSLVATSAAVMTVTVNATAADASTYQTSTSVNATILAADSTAPTVTLHSPSSGSSSNVAITTFNITVMDTANISNVSLYGNWNGTWMINQTNSSGDNNVSYLFNVSLGTGVYTWNVYACDETGNCAWATANYTYTIDQDAPVVTFTLPSNATNVSSGTNVSFAFTLNENATGNYTYDANVTYAFTTTDSVSGLINGSLNRSVVLYGIVPNGNHNITVLAVDSLGNLATYVWNFTVYDTTAPNVTSHTIIGNATSQSSGTTTITIKINENAYCYISTNSSLNVSTNVSAAGGTLLSGIRSGLSNSLTYSFGYTANATKGPYYVVCKDVVPNNMTTAYTIPAFAVKIIPADDDDDSSTSNTPSSTPYFDATYVVSADDLDEGYSNILSLTKRFKFKVGIENHYLAINKITTKNVTINVTSTLQQATIKEGSSAKFELTNDTYYDVLVTVENIDGDEVNMSMKNIHELIVEEEPEEEIEEQEEEVETLAIDAPVTVCGDGIADTDETCSSCPADVVCGEGLTCVDGSCVEEQSEPPVVEKETGADGWKIAGIIIWVIAVAFGLYWYFVLKNPPQKHQKHPSQPHAMPKEPPQDAHKKFEHHAVHASSHYGGKKIDPKQEEHHESNYHRQNH